MQWGQLVGERHLELRGSDSRDPPDDPDERSHFDGMSKFGQPSGLLDTPLHRNTDGRALMEPSFVWHAVSTVHCVGGGSHWVILLYNQNQIYDAEVHLLCTSPAAAISAQDVSSQQGA